MLAADPPAMPTGTEQDDLLPAFHT